MMTPVFFLTLAGCLLLAVYAVLILYYQRAWESIPLFTPVSATGGSMERVRITVLVPARNEEKNIGACLASLSGQTYPREAYEVIVIDDHSTDGTAALAKTFPVSCISLAGQEGAAAIKAFKKFAIETGINAATGELIVTTDADCIFHPEWLSTLAAFYKEKGAKFIAAPVRMGGGGAGHNGVSNVMKTADSFLSVFQTLDFITLQGITGAAVAKRVHSMCNGANLAYEKKTFYEVGGFKDIDTLPSGDDLLLMHKIYKKYPMQVFFLKSRQAIVSTRPETNWRGFINQRIRWASKASGYEDRRIFWVLLGVYLVNATFAALLVAAFWNSWWLWVGLLLLLVKTAVEYPFVRSVAGFFGQRRLLVYFPALQPFHIVYTLVIGWMGQFGHYRWKDRKISK
jgi:cellulose synthase/poly-beta-1,6-N-acetylglucosamine synthase-like glycosyltransferase